jgi:hypothetical protein
MPTGRCLCGAIRYEVTREIGVVVNCHCQFCRRAHGAAFVSVAPVESGDFHVLAGEDSIQEVHTSGVGLRAFCRQCATRLYNRPESNDRLTMLVVGSLDEDPPVSPSMHVNIESKAGWYEILDDLPCFPGLPPGHD